MIYLMIAPALIALFASYSISRKVLLQHVKKYYSESISIQNKRIYLFFSVIGGLLMILPAHFLSIVVGGNMGGGYGSIIGRILGIERIGIDFVIAFGIFAVALIVIMFGVLTGSIIGDALIKIKPRPYLFYPSLLLVFCLIVFLIKSTIPILWL